MTIGSLSLSISVCVRVCENKLEKRLFVCCKVILQSLTFSLLSQFSAEDRLAAVFLVGFSLAGNLCFEIML